MDWVTFWSNLVITGILLYVFQKVIDERASMRLENFKKDLRVTAFEHETRFARLHEDRALIVADLYKQLTKTQRVLKSALDSANENVEVNPTQKEINTAFERTEEFQRFFEEHRIYLSEDLCEKIEELGKKFRTTGIGLFLSTGASLDSENGHSKAEVLKRIDNFVDQEIPPIKRAIETEFRTMLGVVGKTSKNLL